MKTTCLAPIFLATLLTGCDRGPEVAAAEQPRFVIRVHVALWPHSPSTREIHEYIDQRTGDRYLVFPGDGVVRLEPNQPEEL